MMKVLIAYASRHGGTKGIAERIGAVLAGEALLEPIVVNVEEDPDPSLADACILGSGVYIGSWLKEAVDYGWRHSAQLAERPVWLFSSGPLKGSTKEKPAGTDPLEDALGPAEGPGSGGRRKVAELSAAIHPRDHRVFFGRFDPEQPPKSMPERLLRLMPSGKDILPPGDYRDWAVIEAWAREVATELAKAPAREPVAAG
jgi:menaquinone-dependent protoporphyrinogen oxidase